MAALFFPCSNSLITQTNNSKKKKKQESRAATTEVVAAAMSIKGLSNAFSVLGLDVDDHQIQTPITDNTDKVSKKGKKPSKMTVVKDDTKPSVKPDKHPTTSEELKMPLAGIDLEMTDKVSSKGKKPSEMTVVKDDTKPSVKPDKLGLRSHPTTSEELKMPLAGIDLEMTDKVLSKGKKPSEMTVVKDDTKASVKPDKLGLRSHPTTSEELKMPLVWIDLEMTGLNIEIDRILEIACIITDGDLTKSVEGPDLVIHQTKECLDNMGEWCKEHHAASGLTNRVLHSTITEREAEKQVIEFVKKHVGYNTALLAGNSIYVDFQYLKKYMPELASLFSHVVVDVSSVKALCWRWFPRDNRSAPLKENKHRAMDDIRESIKELKYYKQNIFKARSKK